MPSKHMFFVAAACAFPLSLAACGGGGGGGDDTQPPPEGAHYGYVISGISVPTTEKQKADFSLDLGGRSSSKLDGVHDNQLGGLIETLSAFVDIQTPVSKAVDTGSILLLVDFQTTDLANSGNAGFGVKIGATAMPPPCTDSTQTVCGQHLKGTGMFTLASDSSTTGVVSGKIVGGAFTGGPGDVMVQLAIGGGTPITLSLMRARVQATISPTGIMNATIGGLLLQSELTTTLVPVLQGQIATFLTQNCTGSPPPTCGCTGDGALFLISLDTNHDCTVSSDELINNMSVQTALAPDVCTTSSCTKPDGVSIGVQVQAVKAAFSGVM
jgi:hypothetical protein